MTKSELIETIAANGIVRHAGHQGRAAAVAVDRHANIGRRAAQSGEKHRGLFGFGARRVRIKIHARTADDDKIIAFDTV